MVILTGDEVLALRNLSLQPGVVDSVVLQRILDKLEVTVWYTSGRYKSYTIKEGHAYL